MRDWLTYFRISSISFSLCQDASSAFLDSLGLLSQNAAETDKRPPFSTGIGFREACTRTDVHLRSLAPGISHTGLITNSHIGCNGNPVRSGRPF